jgi:hypothetical protein
MTGIWRKRYPMTSQSANHSFMAGISSREWRTSLRFFRTLSGPLSNPISTSFPLHCAVIRKLPIGAIARTTPRAASF